MRFDLGYDSSKNWFKIILDHKQELNCGLVYGRRYSKYKDGDGF